MKTFNFKITGDIPGVTHKFLSAEAERNDMTVKVMIDCTQCQTNEAIIDSVRIQIDTFPEFGDLTMAELREGVINGLEEWQNR